MLDHRLQLLLDEERYRKVAVEARLRGTSIAAVIREAIDQLRPSASVRAAAIDAILAAEPMDVPGDPDDLRRELHAARGRMAD